MDVAATTTPQTTATTTATATAGSTTGAASGAGAISSDFETFLKMLTVQMQNQDPLNPIESSDFAVQLATFSGVEQQVKTNDLLAAMSTQLDAMNMSDLGGWVGMEARAITSAWFEDSPITLQPDPATGAEQTFLVVRDAAGNLVDRVEIPVTDEPVIWSGIVQGGETVPPGFYTINLQSYSNDTLIADDQIAVFSEVVEARIENGETVLVLRSGDEVVAAEIDALRMPENAG